METVNRSKLESNGMSLAIVVSLLYAVVNEISKDITFATSSGEGTINFGIFVPASAAIIFGKGVGSTAAGLGGLLTEIQNALFTEQSAGLDMTVVVTSLANFLGAYITGYLAKSQTLEPRQLKAFVRNKALWQKILQNTAAAIIGMSMTANFADIYINRVNNTESFDESTIMFLTQFFESAIVLVISIPVLLLLFETMERLMFNRGLKFDSEGRKVNWEVADPGDAEIESVTLPEHSFFKNIWTKVEVKFKNKTGRETSFSIEGVSTAQLYPHLDSSKVLQPDESWVQSFYVLPSEGASLELRFRITPTTAKVFKAPIADDAIVNVSGLILDPTKNKFGILQFSGLNFSVLGLSIIWQDIINAFNNPSDILDGFRGNTEILGLTALIETIIVLPIVYLVYRRQKSKVTIDQFNLAFSQDLESHGYEEKAKQRGLKLLLTYQRVFFRLFQILIGLATIMSIGYLGSEGFKVWDDSSYTPSNPDWVLLGTTIVIITWVFALRGMEILSNLSKKRLPPWILKPGEVILDFKPMKQFQVGIANDVIITAQNPTDMQGLRIVFQGQDSVSPPMVEIHASPGEVVNFKISVTPLHKDTSDILAVVYPFFDDQGKLLNFDESEPIARQDINFVSAAQTKLGITQSQQSKLFKIGGVGTVVGVLVTFINRLFPEYPEIGELIRENGPYLAILQAPFAYLYFYYQNKLKGAQTSL
ncbi:MAG: hypothetical protein GPJ54_10630 [Candidatus Heimdallarchaeota archaeon]|nr:hypothetical protein [Candidatus Heimdallarchaeota archaeon]